MKKISAAVISAAMLGTFVSCGSSDKEQSKVKTIGIALPTQELERWNNDGEFLKNNFESAGYNVELIYSDNNSVKQNNDIGNMIDKGVDLLLVTPVDGDKLSDTLVSAKESDIPVVAYDRLIMDSDAVTYYISFDNYAVGKLQGKFVKEKLDLEGTAGPYNIEFVGGDAGDNNARFFFEGAYDALSSYINNGKLVIPSGMTNFIEVSTAGWSSDKAKNRLNTVINSYYSSGNGLDAVICANDSTALGAVQALEESYNDPSAPIVTGQDGDIANLKNIVDGTQSMTVYKNVQDEATVAFEICKLILDGETPAASLAKTLPVEVNFDSESYNNGVKYVQSYLLVPDVITKNDLQALVDTGNYKWDDKKIYLEAANS